MTQAKMDELKIFKGDAVVLKGKFANPLLSTWDVPLIKIPLNVINGGRLS
jgi:hypothetical protein